MSRFTYILILACSISLPGCVSANRDPDFPTINSIEVFETELAKVSDKASVLVVFDIDDTLLKSTNFFGGDTWYNWQDGAEVKHTNGETIFIEDWRKPNCLISDLAITYEIANFEPVEKETTQEVVKRIQSDFDTLVLTSRSPGFRNGTLRELNDADLSFAGEHMLEESHQTFSYNLGRSVMYEKGVIMSSGLNKGVVLRDFLENKVKRQYSTIFFIDDGEKNIKNMGKEYAKDPAVSTQLFLYARVPKEISDMDINNSRLSRIALNTFLQIAAPDRYKEISSKNCPYPQ